MSIRDYTYLFLPAITLTKGIHNAKALSIPLAILYMCTNKNLSFSSCRRQNICPKIVDIFFFIFFSNKHVSTCQISHL